MPKRLPGSPALWGRASLGGCGPVATNPGPLPGTGPTSASRAALEAGVIWSRSTGHRMTPTKARWRDAASPASGRCAVPSWAPGTPGGRPPPRPPALAEPNPALAASCSQSFEARFPRVLAITSTWGGRGGPPKLGQRQRRDSSSAASARCLASRGSAPLVRPAFRLGPGRPPSRP